MSYYNNYRKEHSDYLNNLFNISPNGIDYHNDYNIGFEFKESFMKKEHKIFFKVPKKQVDLTDFFIFCLASHEYFLVDKRDILENFSFNTKEHNANIRINTIKRLSLYDTSDVFHLKGIIDKIKEEDF